MTASTLPELDAHQPEHVPHTPSVEVDVPAALSTIHTTERLLTPDARGGTALDVGHPAMAPLLPYLGASGTWVVLSDPGGIAAARRAVRFADTVVLDARSGRAGAALRSSADLVVLPVELVAPAGDRAGGPATLLDLGGLPPWRLAPALFTGPEIVGFHVVLPAAPDPAADARAVAAVGCGLRRWAEAGRLGRPLLLVRGAGPLAARRVAGAIGAACRADALPPPVLRVDATAAVLDAAVRTVVRVLAVERLGARPLLHLDALPAAVDPALRVLRSRGPAGAPDRVLITTPGRLRTAWLHGGPAVPGSELAAAGWVATAHPLVVHGFAAG